MSLGPLDKEPLHFEIGDFLGGLNSFFPANKIGTNFMTRAKNAQVLENGVLTRRFGFQRLGELDTTILSPTTDMPVSAADIRVAGEGASRKIFLCIIFENEFGLNREFFYGWNGSSWGNESDTTGLIVAAEDVISSSWVRESDGTEWVYYAIGAESSPTNTWAKVPITAGQLQSFLPDTNLDPPARARYVINHVDRVWAAGIVGDNREWLFYSALPPLLGVGSGGNELWDRQANAVTFNTGSGQGIRGIAPYKENLIFVGMESSCFLLALATGTSVLDSERITVSNDIGVGSHKSIVNVGEDLVFMDQYGDYRALSRLLTEQGSAVRSTPISIPIKDRTEAIEQAELFKTVSAFHHGLMWTSFKTTTGWELYSYNVQLETWMGPHEILSSVGVVLDVVGMDSSAGTPGASAINNRSTNLYFLTDDRTSSSTRFQVWAIDRNRTNDLDILSPVAIGMEVMTKALDFGAPHEEKLLDKLEVTYKKTAGPTGHLEISARVDFEPQWTHIGDLDYSTGREIDLAEFHLESLGMGRTFQFRFTSEDRSSSPEIIRAVIELRAFSSLSAG